MLDNNDELEFFKWFLSVKCTYEKALLHNYSKMKKVVNSIFGGSDQINALQVFNIICNNCVM